MWWAKKNLQVIYKPKLNSNNTKLSKIETILAYVAENLLMFP